MVLIPTWLVLLLAVGTASPQEMTWIATDGNWGTASNWDPQNVPNAGGESALIPDGPGSFTVTCDMDFGVDRIRVLNRNATINLGGRLIWANGPEGLINNGVLRANATSQVWGRIENTASARTVIETGRILYLHGPTLINDGEILVNEQGTGDAALDITHPVDLSGGGAIVMNGDNENDLISSYYGYALTQRAGHTIRGFGGITAPLVNYGTVDADRPGGFIRLSATGKTNNGLFRASNGGLLHTSSVTIENAGGTILADGGDVLFQDGYINGGTIDRTGSSVARSRNTRFTNVTIAPTGWVDLPSGYGVYLLGSTLTNDGTIRVNDTGTGDSFFDIRVDLSLAGSGEILLNGDQGDVIMSYSGGTLTQQAGHTIRGSGAITARFVNHGTIDADRSGGYLRISGSDKTNDGLLRASNGGELQIRDNYTLQNAGGTIFADGGNVQLYNQAKVVGGTISRSGSSAVKAQNGWISDLTIVEDGWVDAATGYTLYMGGSQLVNNGTIRLNDTGAGDAWIDVRTNVSLTGTGAILMNGNDNSDYIHSYTGSRLTQEADHTIRGKGRILCSFLNRGTVRADVSGVPLRVDTSGFNNQSVCEATGGAQLQIHQAPQNYASRTLTGGTWIARTNSSIALNNAPVDTANATILLDGPNSNIHRDYGGGNGLSGFARIGPAGDFTIQHGRDFSTTGNLRIDGRLNVTDGCTWTVPGTCSFSYGEARIEGILESPNPIVADFGTLRGSGIVRGNVVNNAGAVAPGSSTGTLRIEGNYAQGSSGRIVAELGGTTPESVDLLDVTGEAVLGGTLEVVAIDGHHVQPGDSYTVMTYGSKQGGFDMIFGKCLEPGVCFDVIYNEHDVTLLAYQIDPAGTEEGTVDLPKELRLLASATAGGGGVLLLDLPRAAHARIAVYDVTGRLVTVLLDGEASPGSHTYRWDSGLRHRLGGGVYFARAVVREGGVTTVRTTRLLVLR